MTLIILEALPDVLLAVLLGLWIAHILGMWCSLFKRDA